MKIFVRWNSKVSLVAEGKIFGIHKENATSKRDARTFDKAEESKNFAPLPCTYVVFIIYAWNT